LGQLAQAVNATSFLVFKAAIGAIKAQALGDSKINNVSHEQARRPVQFLPPDCRATQRADNGPDPRGAPFHPQTPGKIERWHQTLKNRVLLENYFLPGDLERQIEAFIEHYNHRRTLHSPGHG
jgi:hypothetical protein